MRASVDRWGFRLLAFAALAEAATGVALLWPAVILHEVLAALLGWPVGRGRSRI